MTYHSFIYMTVHFIIDVVAMGAKPLCFLQKLGTAVIL